MTNDYGTFRRHIWAVPFECAMLAGAFLTYSKHDLLHLGTSLFTLTVSFAPLLFERFVRVRLPAVLQVTYVGFIFSSMFLGEVFDIYGLIWEWDDAVHFVAGLLLGLAGIIWLTTLTGSIKSVRIPVWLQTIFVYCFVITILVVWEVAEFTSDQLFGTTSQGPRIDTMGDLLYGSVGGALVCALLASHLVGKNIKSINFLLGSYTKINQRK